jgi:hypothetical protein
MLDFPCFSLKFHEKLMNAFWFHTFIALARKLLNRHVGWEYGGYRQNSANNHQ